MIQTPASLDNRPFCSEDRRDARASAHAQDGVTIRRSFLLESVVRHALLVAIIFVGQELARHDKLHAVSLRVGEAVEFEIKVDRGHDAVAEFLLYRLYELV